MISELGGDFIHADDPALLVLDLATDRVHPLPMHSKPASGWGEDSCTAPPTHLGSHGIHLSKRTDGRMEVLVVNHVERESIEAIELVHNSSGYAGVWHGCVSHPTGLFNDVAATGDGGFVATIMMEKSLNARKDSMEVILSGKDTGYIVEWHPGRSLIRLPNSEAPLNNGIQLSKDRRFIYFNAWSVRQVRKRATAGRSSVVKVSKSMCSVATRQFERAWGRDISRYGNRQPQQLENMCA